MLHYRRADGNYDGWGLHVWDGAANPTEWSAPLKPTRTDAFGAVFRVPLAAGATGLNYIIHQGDTKDLPDDQRLDVASAGREVWLLAATPGRLLPSTATTASGDTDISKQKAHWIDRSTVAWQTPPTDGRTYALVAAPAGGVSVVDGELTGTYTTLPLRAQRNGLTEAQRDRFPHLWSYRSFALDRADLAKVPAALRGQLLVTERDAEGALLAATGVQIPGVLDDVYSRAADATLGPTFAGRTPSLALWAPTARTRAPAPVRLAHRRAEGGADAPRRPHRRLVGARRPHLDREVLQVRGAGLAAGGAEDGHRVGDRPVLGGPRRGLHAQPARRPERRGAGPDGLAHAAQTGTGAARRRRRSPSCPCGTSPSPTTPCRPSGGGRSSRSPTREPPG